MTVNAEDYQCWRRCQFSYPLWTNCKYHWWRPLLSLFHCWRRLMLKMLNADDTFWWRLPTTTFTFTFTTLPSFTFTFTFTIVNDEELLPTTAHDCQWWRTIFYNWCSLSFNFKTGRPRPWLVELPTLNWAIYHLQTTARHITITTQLSDPTSSSQFKLLISTTYIYWWSHPTKINQQPIICVSWCHWLH